MNKLKQTRGITLVALVITIIVLLILAGVTLSIVWNGGIIEKSANAVDKYENSTAVEQNKIEYTANMFEKFYYNAVNRGEVAGGTSGGGAGGGSATQWTIVTDYGSDGLSVGDLIAPTVTGVTSERFYVIDNTGGVATLLAEKNVKTNDSTATNNIQNASADTLKFDDSSNVYYTNSTTQSYIKGKVDEYVGKLVTAGLTLEDVETVEGGSAVSGVKGRLMWGTNSSGEVKTLLNAGFTTIVYGPIAGTGIKLNYWLGSPHANYASYTWHVDGSNGNVNYGNVYYGDYYRSSPSYKNFII